MMVLIRPDCGCRTCREMQKPGGKCHHCGCTIDAPVIGWIDGGGSYPFCSTDCITAWNVTHELMLTETYIPF